MTTLSLAGQPPQVPLELTPYYRAGRGTPLVLLHGASMSWRAWRPVLPLLTGRHDVFAPTLPGHRGGPEPVSDGEPNIDTVADQLCAQLDEAGIETAHLVGNSLGGWLAFELARRGRVRSVLALSPAGSWQARRDLVKLLWTFRVGFTAVDNPRLSPLSGNRLLRRVGLSRVLAHPGLLSGADEQNMVDDMRACTLLRALMGGSVRVEPMTDFDVALCPVHIAWAERDRIIPYRRYGRPMQRVVRGARFSVLPDVGHVPMHDDPRLIARTILEQTTAVDADAATEEKEPRLARLRRRRRSA